MNIESVSSGYVKPPVTTLVGKEEPENKAEQIKTNDAAEASVSTVANSPLDKEIQHSFDKASGLLQTIVSDKISDKIIRKLPSDEYLRLLNMMDKIMSGSVDKEI